VAAATPTRALALAQAACQMGPLIEMLQEAAHNRPNEAPLLAERAGGRMPMGCLQHSIDVQRTDARSRAW
jgi:hypothetical protein